jgi:transposase-like protein
MSDGIEELARRLVVGHKRDGRSIYDEKAKRELVQPYLKPGKSLAKVARKCGINANVLSNWVRLHERAKTRLLDELIVALRDDAALRRCRWTTLRRRSPTGLRPQPVTVRGRQSTPLKTS